MKKILAIGLLSVAAVFANAASVSMTIPGNTMTNLLSVNNGSLKVTQLILSAPTSGGVTIQAIDNSTNSVKRINPAYTNTLSYVTNLVTTWVNYFGVTNTMTNTALVDVTNNPVAAVTNTISPTITASTAGNTSTTFSGVSYYFNYGLWITNTSPSNAAVTVTYQQ